MDGQKRLSKNFKQAPIWQIIDQGAGRFVRIAASIVLARILFPEDFGIYALSLSLLEMARLSVNLGIGAAIVQTPDSPDEFATSAFWVNLVASSLMFLNSIFFAFIGAKLLDVSVLIKTVPVLGITLITGGITHINQSLLIRDLEFKTLAKASVTKLAVESLSSIIFAVLGFGYWAFILGYVLGDIAQSILIWLWTDWRPRLQPDFRYPKKYWKFGANIFIFALSTYLLEYMPNIIVGHVATAYILGLFSFAWRQSRWIGDIPKLIGKNMLFPAFSRLQTDALEFEKLYERWLRFMMTWGAPFFILQFVFAPLYVPFIFGDKWIPAVVALQLLSVMAFTQVTFYVPHSEALTAQGRVERNVVWRIIEALILGGVLFVMAQKGATAIAAAILVVRTGILPFYLITTHSILHIHPVQLLQKIFPCLMMTLIGWLGAPLLYHYGQQQHIGMSLLMATGLVIFWFLFGFKLVPETKKLLKEVTNVASEILRAFKKTAMIPLD